MNAHDARGIGWLGIHSKALLWILLIVMLMGQTSLAETPDSTKTIEYPLVPLEAVTDALLGIKMTLSDLGFRTDYVETDAFRLKATDDLTRNPLAIPKFLQDCANCLLRDSFSARQYVDFGAALISKSFNLDSISAIKSGDYNNIAPASSFRKDIHDSISYVGNLSRLEKIALQKLFNKVLSYYHNLRSVNPPSTFSGLTAQELTFLRDTFPELMLDDVNDEFKPIEELDRLQKYDEELTQRSIPICAKLKLSEIYRIDYAILAELDSLIGDLHASEISLDSTMINRDWLIESASSGMIIAIGGWGNNNYTGKHQVIIDLGGDDLYELDRAEGAQIIIDLRGNDVYLGKEDFCLGSGLFGLGILVDLAGDDLYNAGNFSLGSGLFGVGMLFDNGGNDIYIGDTHTQGAATFGLGLLYDRGGNDQYNCALSGQAYAGPGGVAALIDRNGNDNYFGGGKYKDILRYNDHYLSFAQGFAIGFRPRMSGGIALLVDSSGHDTYISDIFGQGASYWHSFGGLCDLAGNDKYFSFQYAQGNGTHMSCGMLMDKNGDDYYFSKGVSQGCGHDLAVGILIDYAGNDSYQAYDLSQAAGSANGLGILIDYLGNDSYEVKSDANTQGYGNPRRDYGSIGLFLDLMGRDYYRGNGKDNSYWIINSKWGIGLDKDYWQAGK